MVKNPETINCGICGAVMTAVKGTINVQTGSGSVTYLCTKCGEKGNVPMGKSADLRFI